MHAYAKFPWSDPMLCYPFDLLLYLFIYFKSLDIGPTQWLQIRQGCQGYTKGIKTSRDV